MDALDLDRRNLLLGLGGLGLSRLLPPARSLAQAAELHGYVLGADQGEQLVHFRDQSRIFIRAGSATGSSNLALGTQQVKVGAGIPIHRHFQMDEAFYVLEGTGSFILNDVHHPFEQGGTIFIPKNFWHGFANPDHELLLLWIVTPAGLDGFFRETCTPPGVPPRRFTHDQINDIARKYATEFR